MNNIMMQQQQGQPPMGIGVGQGAQPQQPSPPQQAQQGQQSPQAMMMGLPAEIRQKLMQVPEPKRSELLRRLSQDYQGASQSLDDQQAMAGQLRSNAPSAEGRQAGSVYVAANPLEHVAGAYQNRKANNMQQEAIDRKKALSEDYGMATQEIMSSMLRK